jgi:polysaccharide biosynthesis protein PelA
MGIGRDWRSPPVTPSASTFVLALAILVACRAPSLGCGCRAPARGVVSAADLARVDRWWIVIGDSQALESADWRHHARDTRMVVLSGDPRVPLKDFPADTIRLGYLSAGELDKRRPPPPTAGAPSFQVEPNPHWPDSVRVDLRDPVWQRYLLREEIPRVMALGFDGLMLDTLDTAAYLEEKDPVRFSGSRKALRDWLQEVRRSFPRAVLVANGTAALVDAAPYVDGFVVEGVFATYDFGKRIYRATTDAERTWKLSQIAQARQVADRPVFTIEYAEVGDVTLSRWASAESSRHGFRPYVAVKDLNTLP